MESYTSGFDAFVAESGAALSRSAYLLTGDHQLAEDLVQTALAKVGLRWAQVAGRGNPRAYVRKVIVHTAVGWRRRRWRGEIASGQLPELTGGDETARVDTRERLRRALLQLPVRQRAAVVLRHYEDLSEADTAQALGCSLGTVKSQTAKGLAKLRSILDDAPSTTPAPPARFQGDRRES